MVTRPAIKTEVVTSPPNRKRKITDIPTWKEETATKRRAGIKKSQNTEQQAYRRWMMTRHMDVVNAILEHDIRHTAPQQGRKPYPEGQVVRTSTIAVQIRKRDGKYSNINSIRFFSGIEMKSTSCFLQQGATSPSFTMGQRYTDFQIEEAENPSRRF